MTTTAIVPIPGASAALTRGSDAAAEPIKLRRRIGSTVFIVNVHFSETSAEKLEDKLLRLMEREVRDSA